MLRVLKQCARVRLYQFASGLIRHERALRITFRGENNSTDKQPSVEEKLVGDKAPTRLTVRWKWVVRGKYKVAAFSTENNPAVALTHTSNKHWHRHKCPNCQTVYDHTHPYGSLHHPQHIKDCPKCKLLAPTDLKISESS